MTAAPTAAELAGQGTSSGPAGGQAQSPTASGLVNLPANSLAPTNTPAAWGLTSQLINAPLFAGTTSKTVVSTLKKNQVLGQIADKLGIKATKGMSLQEQIIQALAKQHGVSLTSLATMEPGSKSTAGGKRNDQDVLGEVAGKLGIGNLPDLTNPFAPAIHVKVPKLKANLDDSAFLGQLATKLGVDTNPTSSQSVQQTTTVGKAAMQIYGMNATQISQLQAKLWEGGFYDENVEGVGGYAGPDAKKLTPGNLDPYTMKAFGTLLTQVANSKQKMSWTDALDEASGLNAQGVTGTNKTPSIEDLTGESASTAASVPKVTLATPDQMMSTLQSYFENKLGRMPTQAELTQFTGQFDAAQTAASKELDPNTVSLPDSSTGVDEEPGVATPAGAATEFAQSNGTEYMAHQVANAGALMLNAMRESGGLGANPNVTQAG